MAAIKAPVGPPELKSRIQGIIRHTANDLPRHQQRAIGPSEIGERCDRRLTYRLLDMDPSGNGGDPWPSIVGIAVHAWLAEAFRTENERLGRLRYLVEQRVQLTSGIGGTCDLYDLDANDVIDHKVLGATSMSKIKRGDVPDRYRVQLHLYGLGFAIAGMPVEKVTLALYSRGGWLDDMHLWSQRWDRDLAETAMDRLSRLTAIAYTLELDTHPERWELVPASAGPDCTWCPFFRPGQHVDSGGCPGEIR